ncbi:MAG: type IV pilus assembly protein PilM [Candidatus Obscuribacterales bacterium]|nr:type IV pilus assembly protein PilM [Candidatus Obscuribacterales bacterium]
MTVFSFGKKKGPVLAVDINSDSITLIQMEKTRAGIEVARFACSPTPGNSTREGIIADPEVVGTIVLDLLANAHVPPGGPTPIINVAIPAQAVVIRLMPVPVGMPPEELADVVTQEATNHVPFPIEDANIDWSAMPATERTDSDGVRRIDIILAAVQRSIIESYWRMADAAGVKLGRVDISSLSVVRSLALAGYLGSSGHLSLIANIRHDATDINIVRSAMPLFGRSVMLGMDTLTEAVSRSLGIHYDEALDLLPEIVLFGLPPTDVRMGQAAQVARTIFSDIADELLRSLDFYKSQVGDVKVDQILLTGPGCLIQNLDQYISNRMNIRTIVADPMRDLVFEPDLILDSMRPILSALVGSSIEPGWNPSFTVNLDLNKEGRLPLLFDERKTMVISPEMRPLPWFKPALTASIAVLVLTLAYWAYLVHFDLPAKDRSIAKLTLEETENRKELGALNNLKQSNSILTSKKKLLDAIVKKSQHWSSVLDEIRTKTPNTVQMEAIVFDGEKLRIQGHATDFKSISELTVNLSDSPNFQQCIVESETRNEKDPDSIAFAVVGDLKNSLSEALPQLSEANHGP